MKSPSQFGQYLVCFRSSCRKFRTLFFKRTNGVYGIVLSSYGHFHWILRLFSRFRPRVNIFSNGCSPRNSFTFGGYYVRTFFLVWWISPTCHPMMSIFGKVEKTPKKCLPQGWIPSGFYWGKVGFENYLLGSHGFSSFPQCAAIGS